MNPMNEHKNILIGKIGKAVKFKNVRIETGGDTTLILYSSLSRMNPEYNFYFIGPNELNRLTEAEYDYIFPNHNVFSAYVCNENDEHWFEGTVEYFKNNNINPDFGLLFNGPVGTANIPNFVKLADGSDYTLLNCFSSFAAPYLFVLNELGIPYYTLSEDARYITINAVDLYNRERLSFTQINAELVPKKHIKSKEDHTKIVTDPIKCIYSGIEKIFLMGIDENWRDQINIDRKLKSDGEHFIVLSNGFGTRHINRVTNEKNSRLPEYKKWVIDNFVNTEYSGTKIYGLWDEESYKNFPQIQKRLIVELDREIADAKYTLVYSMIPGFVTVKPYEVIVKGILPFLHPDYDKFHLLDIPEYLYVKTPEELLEKVRELDNNPELYLKLLNECFELITPDLLNGSRINNFLFSKIGEDLGFEYEKKNGVKSIFNHYNKNVFDYQSLNSDKNLEKNNKNNNIISKSIELF